MELKSLQCPNCGATLDIEDGLDTFFCKYCGYKILLEGQSKAAYEAKVCVKHMEHEERLQDKRDSHERFKMEFAQKDQRNTFLIVFSIFGAIIALCLIISLFGNAGAKRQERELQAIVDQIMIDIENEDFAEAYVKANSLYWDDSWTSKGEEKWHATRKEVIKQIEEAEKKVTGTTSNSAEDDSGEFWDWFN
ncbi:MAG: hypothetical protein IJO28_08920 [Oscillospiraceae bacterium]|nr:hypothetical protein [Oscillospiraceae bacterium]